ncbi:unnamed protein product [Mytilus edulis]|uniref:Endonuclease/exonuclease/phosphatase domain-containing protein n=1 Tax=Mytilus edulis TaxID=6550 RepID=A0A8S3TU88_MYTED|nr:unnamed protein product [Mytilus edulis]
MLAILQLSTKTQIDTDSDDDLTVSASDITVPTSDVNTEAPILDQDDASHDIFHELYTVRKKHPNKFISSYLNINSLRYKFCSIQELLCKNIVDLLIIAETKIDQSFPDAQFRVDNYHFWRKDRNAHGGGIVMYIRSDLPCDRKQNMECEIIESIAAELVVNGKKWLISGMYRPQTISDNDFINDFTKTHDKISVKYDNMIFLGDLNYNLLSIDKCTPLSTVCDICGIENIVKGATCFTKDAKPTLNDVILTNKKNMLQNTTNFNCGLSDVHNIIAINNFIKRLEHEGSSPFKGLVTAHEDSSPFKGLVTAHEDSSPFKGLVTAHEDSSPFKGLVTAHEGSSPFKGLDLSRICHL